MMLHSLQFFLIIPLFANIVGDCTCLAVLYLSLQIVQDLISCKVLSNGDNVQHPDLKTCLAL